MPPEYSNWMVRSLSHSLLNKLWFIVWSSAAWECMTEISSIWMRRPQSHSSSDHVIRAQWWINGLQAENTWQESVELALLDISSLLSIYIEIMFAKFSAMLLKNGACNWLWAHAQYIDRYEGQPIQCARNFLSGSFNVQCDSSNQSGMKYYCLLLFTHLFACFSHECWSWSLRVGGYTVQRLLEQR